MKKINELHGIKIGQEVTYRLVHRGGYGYVSMVKAIIENLSPKRVRIKCWKIHRNGNEKTEEEVFKNVSYDNIKESTLYKSW